MLVYCFQIVHKKVCFFDRCGETGNSVDGSMTCGDINDVSWSGVIMTSTCSLSNTQRQTTAKPFNGLICR